METKNRSFGLVTLLASALVLYFLFEKWYPLFLNYQGLSKYSYLNWEKQIIFLFLSFLGIILITIFAGSLFSIILGRRHWNIEFFTGVGLFLGSALGVFITMFFIFFINDLCGLNVLFYSILSSSSFGLILGIKNEIEDDEGVC